MNQKIYPNDVIDQIQKIGHTLKTLFNSQKTNLRAISKFSDMSINSVKSVLAGKTANIASYALVAKALGTDLVSIIANMHEGKVTSAKIPISTGTSLPITSGPMLGVNEVEIEVARTDRHASALSMPSHPDILPQ
jgi:lambda repressor-like predicted transcriptional regulator